MKVPAVSVLGKNSVSHPSILAEDHPPWLCQRSFRSQHRLFISERQAARLGKPSRQNSVTASVREKTVLVPHPSFSQGSVSSSRVTYPVRMPCKQWKWGRVPHKIQWLVQTVGLYDGGFFEDFQGKEEQLLTPPLLFSSVSLPGRSQQPGT